MDQGFSRQYRILTGPDYRRVFNKPVRVGCRGFTILACPGDLPHARLGLAVSKKVDKRAVKRNHLKRLARESFRRNPLRDHPIDLVVIAKPASASMSADNLHRALNRHWAELASRFPNSSSRANASR